MNTQTAPTPAYLQTLVDCEKKMREDGYKESFSVQDGCLIALSTCKSYSADEIRIVNFYRFEGQTDPSDSAIMYVIETKDGTKGTLVDGYGPSADSETGSLILKVESIQKKNNVSNKQ
jgi:hypothetical protein